MSKEEFIEELEKLNIRLSEKQVSQLEKYYSLLIEWNKKINLTRIIEEKDVWLKHFYDSITLVKACDLHQDLSICDIGTGAGFPGMVLKIVFPHLSITLVDALLKRIKFLDCVIQELDLKDINTVHIRAEDFVKHNKQKYDIAVSRAVGKLSLLIHYSLPLLKKNGLFLAMKSNCQDELVEAQKVLKKYTVIVDDIIEFELPYENSRRTIVKIRKK